MNKYYKILLLILTLLLIGLSLTFISKEKENPKLTVAATIFPFKDMITEVAGDKLEVIQILPSGASPHTYDASVKDKETISKSSLVFIIGLEADTWAQNLIDDKSKVVELHNDIELIESKDEDEHNHKEVYDNTEPHSDDNKHIEEEELHDDEQKHEHNHGNVNPHYWLSIENAKIIVNTINAELSALDPKNAQYYKQNTQNYINQLDTKKQEYLLILSEIHQKKIITFHDAFPYLAREYNLEIASTIEPFPGKEPTPAYLAQLGEIVKTEEIEVIFGEPQLSDTVANTLSEEYDLDIFILDPLGGLEERDSYINLMNYNINTLYQALR